MEGSGEAVVILTDVDESEVNVVVLKFFEAAVFFFSCSIQRHKQNILINLIHFNKHHSLQVTTLVSFVTLGQDPSHPSTLNLQSFLKCPPWMAKYTQESDVFVHEMVDIENLNTGNQPASNVDLSDVRQK